VASLGRRIVANAFSAFASQAALALVGLVATAILVRALGIERFGAWSLVGAVVAYLGLFDLGLGVALVRRIAAVNGAAADRDGAARALGATLVATLALGALAASLVFLLASNLAHWLRIPDAHTAEFVTALRVSGAAAALALPGVVLGAVPTAFQRLDALVRLETMVSAVTIMWQAGAALGGGGLVTLAVVSLAGRAASLGGRLVLAWRMVGPPAGVDWRYPFWRELGRFGALKLVHQLASQLVLYLDRLLVGALVSASAVAYYTVSLELAQRLLVVQQNVAAAFYPAACALATERAAFTRLYVRTSRVVSLFTLPLAAALAIAAEPVLRVWVGEPFVEPSAALLRVVALAYGGMALTAVPAGAADALNHPEIAARYATFGVALNVALALLLIPPFGPIGAGWALALNVALQSPWFVRRVTVSVVGVSLGRYAGEVLGRPLVPAAIVAAAVGAALAAVGAGTASLGAASAVGLGAFVLAVRALGAFDEDERRFVSALPGGRMLRWVVGG
jgi:O-antigen/teichoic acid export membrane protein